MKKLLLYMLENILETKDIGLTEKEENGMTVFSILVPKEEIGKVIGKNGRIINSLKSILKIKAIKENKLIDVKVAEK